MKWARTVLLLAVWTVLSACSGCQGPPPGGWDLDDDGVTRVAILGDSNSFTLWPENWVLALRAELAADPNEMWQVRPYARPGAWIGVHPTDPRLDGMTQIQEATSAAPPADMYLMAFGTNDHRGGQTPEQIVESYRRAVVQIVQIGARARIATVPPCWNEACRPEEIVRVNALMRRRWANVIDFDSWVTPVDLIDDLVHFTAAGHAKRLEAALCALRS